MQAVSVYVGGQKQSITLGRGKDGGVFPTAVLGSGVQVILTSTAMANAIYGALGIGPASDGNCESPFKNIHSFRYSC